MSTLVADRIAITDGLDFDASANQGFLYVHNEPTNYTDPSGLAQKPGWRVEYGHGDRWHIQLGDKYWDAITLEPIEHMGQIAKPLTPAQLEEIRKLNLWDKIIKNTERAALERALVQRLGEEAARTARAKGLNCLNRRVAREVAKQALLHSPLALFFIATQANGAVNDYREHGAAYAVINQEIPIELIEQVGTAAAHAYANKVEDYLTLGHGLGHASQNRLERNGFDESGRPISK